MSTSAADLNIIKFSPKTNLNTNPQVPEINKLTAENINEILNFINSTLFPVGTMLFNDNPDFDPNVEYGGTWYSSNPKDYTDNTGNSQPMDIMNPHYVANIWHRVA